jgi:hypothetical protein
MNPYLWAQVAVGIALIAFVAGLVAWSAIDLLAREASHAEIEAGEREIERGRRTVGTVGPHPSLPPRGGKGPESSNAA